MKAKDYLNQLAIIEISIHQKLKELEAFDTQIIGSIDYSKEKVQTSFTQEAIFTKMLEKKEFLEKKINAEIDNYIDQKHQIIQEIQNLKNKNQIQVLLKHYVEYKPFKVIAKEMQYSYSYVIRLHQCALKAFQK